MSCDIYIGSARQAKAIIEAYHRCGNCGNCPLHTCEGWRCSYLYEMAVKYLEKVKRQGGE